MIKLARIRLNYLFLMWLALGMTACEFPSGNSPTAVLTVEPSPEASPVVLPATNTPEPTLALPTQEPTQIPLPTPTIDPEIDDWTVMVYLDADNSLELSGLKDVNEMEAAGQSEEVNILVQIDRASNVTDADDDWTDARRYLIRGDKTPDQITSEPVEFLDEVNMGDPEVLTDFLTWGMRNYPANRYALILWDHGAGWNGFAFDSDVGFPDQSDHITLEDLSLALADALAQSDVDKFDVIGFDACLMGQLDVLLAVQPYADYAVGSEALTPGKGWDYESLFRQLFADSSQDGAEMARNMVDEFATFYRLSEPDDFVTMAAVDLAGLPAVAHAVENLATALATEPVLFASFVGDARSGAEAFARVYRDEFENYAALDLHHFASILAQRSPDALVADLASQVVDAINETVIAHESGAGFRHSGGIAAYFPRTSGVYDPQYAGATVLDNWDRFLTSYHEAGLTALPPPQIGFTTVLSDSSGVLNPAYLAFEIIGRDIETVVLNGGRYEPDGRLRLLEHFSLIPEPSLLADGSRLLEWRDGVHEDFFVWNTRVTYVHDGEGNGDFVVMWPTDPESPLYSVQGRYRHGDGQFVEASLIFDQDTGRMVRVWGIQGNAAAEISPEPGDEFQIQDLYRLDDGDLQKEPGLSLYFDESSQLYFDWRPLADGDYFLELVVENVAGAKASAFTDIGVVNSLNSAGYEAYLDPYLGFQFQYPSTWHAPHYEESLLYSNNVSGTTQLQITLYPNLEPATDSSDLQKDTLNHFGPVDLLYPTEQINVAGTQGLRTVYGYERVNDGPHTGLLLTFVKDGIGYVVDVDGPLEEETSTLQFLDQLLASWTFRPAQFGLQPGDWATVELDGFEVARPSDFVYQEVNGWQRFSSDRYTFVALRTQPATLESANLLSTLVRDAGAGVEDYEAGDPFELSLGGSVWLRSDFSYIAANDVEIWGFIMAKVESGIEVVAWAEAPASTYNALESPTFLMMIADMDLTE